MRYSFLLISIFVFFVSGAYARTPVLNIEPSLYLVDGVFHLEGTADSDVRIELEFSKTGARSLRRFINAEKDGKWFFNEKLALAEGEWTVRARAREGDGENSEWSDAVVFQSIIQKRGFNFLFLAIIIGAAIVLFFAVKIVRRFKKEVLPEEKHEIELSDSAIEQNTIIPRALLNTQHHYAAKQVQVTQKVNAPSFSEIARHKQKRDADFEQEPFVRRFRASASRTNDIEEKN